MRAVRAAEPSGPSPAAPTAATPAWLLDSAAATAGLRAAGVAIDRAEPTYLREKAGESAVVGYRLVAGGATTAGYVRWCADAMRASVEWHKAVALVPDDTDLGPGAVRIGDRAVLRIFPNDAGLRRARWYFTPRKLKRTLSELDHGGRVVSGSRTSVEVLTYKPERRAVARVDLGYRDGSRSPVILRYTVRPAAGRLAATAAHLAANGVTTARSLATLESGRVTIDELLPGSDLGTIAVSTASDPASAAAVATAVADQVAALHDCPAPVVAPIRRLDDVLAATSAALRWLDGRGDVDARLAGAVWDRLVAASTMLPPAAPTVIHGDLHDRNVLVDLARDGSASAALIDLERVALGDPAIDLGYLAAHGLAGAIRRDDGDAVHALLTRVVSDVAERRRVADTALGFHTAVGLVEAALTAARHLDSVRRPDLVPQLLETAVAQVPARTGSR